MTYVLQPVCPKPSKACVICGGRRTGGIRLTGNGRLGIFFSHTRGRRGCKNFNLPVRRDGFISDRWTDKRDIRIGKRESPNGFLVVWGPDEVWTESAIRRALTEYTEGTRSWVCQYCAGSICSVCGESLPRAVGCNVLHDNGETWHEPTGYRPGCRNRSCSQNRPKAKEETTTPESEKEKLKALLDESIASESRWTSTSRVPQTFREFWQDELGSIRENIDVVILIGFLIGSFAVGTPIVLQHIRDHAVKMPGIGGHQ